MKAVAGERLREVLRRWPDFSKLTTFKERLEELRPLLAADFRESDLGVVVEGIEEILNVSESEDVLTIDFEGAGGGPYRAVFISENGNWLLRSLTFQCQACFGSGQDEAGPCKMCAGSGWGVA